MATPKTAELPKISVNSLKNDYGLEPIPPFKMTVNDKMELEFDYDDVIKLQKDISSYANTYRYRKTGTRRNY